MTMKYLAIVLLVVLGVYLYRRAKRLAEDEQEVIKPAEKEIDEVPAVEKSSVDEAQVEDVKVVEAVVAPLAETTEVEKATDIDSIDQIDSVDSQKLASGNQATAQEEVAVAAVTLPIETPAEPEAPNTSDTSWANDKLSHALVEYRRTSDSTVKHQALLASIGECYKHRKQAEYVNYGAGLTSAYLELFSSLKSPSSEKGVGFMHLSTLLNDAGLFDEAISICQKATSYGLNDGTVTGFEGRISRIEKAKTKSLK